jgi:hypothetical protein
MKSLSSSPRSRRHLDTSIATPFDTLDACRDAVERAETSGRWEVNIKPLATSTAIDQERSETRVEA